MKMIKYLACLSFAALAVGCSGEDDHGLKGNSSDAVLSFNAPTLEQTLFVFTGTGSSEATVTYGITSPVSGSHTVKLVVDTEKSSAVEGTDFVIENPTDELADGETTGEFKVKFLEDAAVQDGKVVVFKLQSDTLDNAIFSQSYKVNVSLTCPVEDFFGDFSAVTWWLDNSEHTIVSTDNETKPNEFKIQDFFPDNADAPDFILNYDPNTFAITFDEQSTGYEYSAGKFITAKQSTTLASYLNPCTRVMHVGVFYAVPGVGSFGDKDEVFTGE